MSAKKKIASLFVGVLCIVVFAPACSDGGQSGAISFSHRHDWIPGCPLGTLVTRVGVTWVLLAPNDSDGDFSFSWTLEGAEGISLGTPEPQLSVTAQQAGTYTIILRTTDWRSEETIEQSCVFIAEDEPEDS